MDSDQASSALNRLAATLQEIAQKDQEQEVRGIALPVLDAVVSAARELALQDDPVLMAVQDVISPESIDAGEPVRAVDARIVVEQLILALDRAHPREPLQMRPEPSIFDRDF